jgi:hypothetical protein
MSRNQKRGSDPTAERRDQRHQTGNQMIQQSKNAAPLSWHSTLNAGDIVAYRFPHERKGAQQPKVRPALVVNVTEKAGERVATLAYGTSNSRLHRDALTLDVQLEAELDEASLHRPTRFHVSRRIEVSLEDTAFNVSPSKQTPVLGRLSGQSKQRLAIVRSKLRAERRAHELRRSKPNVRDATRQRALQKPSPMTMQLKQEHHHA